jgi:hypothetical protein
MTEDSSNNVFIAITEFAALFEVIEKLELLLVKSYLHLFGFIIHAKSPRADYSGFYDSRVLRVRQVEK